MLREEEDTEVHDAPPPSETPMAEVEEQREDRESRSRKSVAKPRGVSVMPTISLADMARVCQLEQLEEDW